MRPNTDNLTRHSGTLTGERVGMTLDENSIVHLMSVLTKLYSDGELAVIREYATNALDSHKAAGNTDPIKVTLPSELEPIYTVQDFGVGLSVDDIINVFSKYGASTKRDNDDEAGMLGLGCKSALTYTDQFTVVGTKGGTKTTAIVAVGENGVGQITIVDTVSTDEPNGVTIKVPVSKVSSFRSKAERFFRWWDADTVLVNGEAPSLPDHVRLSDDLIISDDLDHDTIVMGGIGYPVDSLHRIARHADLPYGYCAVKWVPMGAVNFVPSREALEYTDRTEKVIRQVREQVSSKLVETANKDVSGAPNPQEAFIRATRWTPLTSKDLTYKGERIPRRFELRESVWTYDENKYRKKATKQAYFDRATLRDAVQVTGYTNKTLSQTNKAKLEKYAEDNDIEARPFILSDDPIGSPWTDGQARIAWDDVAEVEVTITSTNGYARGPRKRVPGSYYKWDGGHTYKRGDREYSFEEIEVVGENVIYYSPSQDVNLQRLSKLFPDYDIIKLSKNRWDKFERENEGVQYYRDALTERRDNWLASLTIGDKLALHSGRDFGEVAQLPYGEIDDPELRDAIKYLRLRNRSDAQETYNDLRWSIGRVNLPDVRETWETKIVEPIDKYPLLRYNKEHTNHLVEYANWCYGKESK